MSARDVAEWELEVERYQRIRLEDLERALSAGRVTGAHWGSDSEAVGDLLAAVTAFAAFPARRWWE